MKKFNYCSFSLMVIIFIFLSSGVLAQTSILKGLISEKVTNKPLPNVAVYLVKEGKVIDQTMTDANGYYTFKKLLPSFFDMKVLVDGYNVCFVKNIETTNEKTTWLDLSVEVKDNTPKEPAFKPLLPLISMV